MPHSDSDDEDGSSSSSSSSVEMHAHPAAGGAAVGRVAPAAAAADRHETAVEVEAEGEHHDEAPLGLLRPSAAQQAAANDEEEEDDDPLSLRSAVSRYDHRVVVTDEDESHSHQQQQQRSKSERMDSVSAHSALEKGGEDIDPDDVTRLPSMPARTLWGELAHFCRFSASSLLCGVGVLLVLATLWLAGLTPSPAELMRYVTQGGGLAPEERLAPKQHYRFLLVGDSLTTGHAEQGANGEQHPYRLELERLLAAHSPSHTFSFDVLAQSGECVTKKCVSKSLVERVNEALRRTDGQGRLVFVDLAIILGGTNDIFHDVSAAQITAGLSSMHWLLWTQPAPAPMPAEGGAAQVAVPFALPKTLAVSIPQFGSDASWRLKNDASKRLPSEVRADVNQHLEALCGTRAEHHQCTYVDLDRLTPRWGVAQEDVAKYWADEVHFNSLGYDRLAQRLFDVIKPMLPDEDN